MRLVAVALVASAIGLLPSCASLTPRQQALVMISRGHVREGVVELEKIRDQHPLDPQAWIDLGHGYELLHRFDDALVAYDRAAQVAPNDPRGPREGGLRTAKWGEATAARPRLEEAIRRGDREPTTFHALGLVLLSLGDHAGARKAYLAGLQTEKGQDDATCVLGLATLAVVEGDANEALRWYDELTRRRPRHADAQLGRAWALGSLGRFAEADAAVEEARALGAQPGDVERMRAFLEKARQSS